jgi:hypothetical protein
VQPAQKPEHGIPAHLRPYKSCEACGRRSLTSGVN